jgi:hypothetical protein
MEEPEALEELEETDGADPEEVELDGLEVEDDAPWSE